MSRLIEEEFDELLLYVAGLKKTFDRKMDDHLFIIQQQIERLDDQARLIDELAWQIRDLRASVRAVGDKFKAFEQAQNQNQGRREAGESQTLPRHKSKSDVYANMVAKGDTQSDGGGGSGGGGQRLRRGSSITKQQQQQPPRITIMQHEEVSEGVEILQLDSEEYYDDDDDQGAEDYRTSSLPQQRRNSYRESYESEGIYEPIQFIERRDYTAPMLAMPPPQSPSSPSPSSSSSSLSARHRQTKQTNHELKQLQRLPPTPQERQFNGRAKRIDQQFHFPPPPPIPIVLEQEELPAVQSLQMRPSQDYQPVVTRRVRTPSFSNVIMTDIVEESASQEQDHQKVEEFMRPGRTHSEREANSIKRRAYILPSTSRS